MVIYGEHPSHGSGDEVSSAQLLEVAVFGGLQGFSDSSSTAFSSSCSGLGFIELYMELPGIELGFFDVVDIVPPLGSLFVVLLVEGEQVVGHILHGGAVFLGLQGFHVGDLGGAILLQRWEGSHGCTGDGLLLDLA